MKGRAVFVSGIDTGIGKTYATGHLARQAMDRGLRVATLKLVQTGNDGFSEDIEVHRRIMGVSLPEDREGLTAPQIFKFPSSPELAARLEGRTVDLECIARAVDTLCARYELVFVEGAGGLMAPLARGLYTIDFAAAQHWPVLLVTSARLGSINHTLLSLEAIANRRMKLAGIAFNWCENADQVIDADTRQTVRAWLKDRNMDQVEFYDIPRI